MLWFVALCVVAIVIIAYTVHLREDVSSGDLTIDPRLRELFSHDWQFTIDQDMCKEKYDMDVPEDNVVLFSQPTGEEVNMTVRAMDKPQEGAYMRYRVEGDLLIFSANDEDVFVISLDEPTIRILHVEQITKEPFIWNLQKV